MEMSPKDALEMGMSKLSLWPMGSPEHEARATLARLAPLIDAAIALGFVVDVARPDPTVADETAGGRALRDFHLAYRALGAPAPTEGKL